MTRKTEILLPFIIVAATASVALAAGNRIIHVDENAVGPKHDGSSWCTAHTTLHDALATATAGDEVRIANGTYRPASAGPGDPRENSFIVPSGVRVLGGYAGCGEPNPNARNTTAYPTTLTGDHLGDDAPNFTNRDDNHYHVMQLINCDSTTLIEGLRINGGNANAPLILDPDSRGAGIYVVGGAPILRQLTLSSNEARWNGGAIFERESQTMLDRCFLFGNLAGNGGALFIEGHPILTDTRIGGNDATLNGGGLFIATNAQADIHGGSMNSNDGSNGGAVHAMHDTILHMDRVFLLGNRATNGGAVYCDGEAHIENCGFAVNSATDSGGAIAFVHSDPGTTVNIRNATIANNSAANGAAGVGLGASDVEFANTILWRNTSNGQVDQQAQIFSSDATPVVNFSCVEGWNGSLGGVGNIGDDPRIAAIGDVPGPVIIINLSLKSGSPCINTGDPVDTLQPGWHDSDGNARVMCGRIDMGLNEFGFGDVDCDQHITPQDFAQWTACVQSYGPGCESLDFEFDGDTDLADFRWFQRFFEGPFVPVPDFATYQLTFDATWSANTHPYEFPSGAHFSPLIGATHDADYIIWEDGGIATPGIESMAETGGTFTLRNEIQAQIGNGNAAQIVQFPGFGSPGEAVFNFTVTRDHPLLSIVTMIAPSPDWFVGADRVELFKFNDWVDELVIPLQPYDAGTDSGTLYTSPNADITPHIPISEITGAPFSGYIGVSPLGTFTIERID